MGDVGGVKVVSDKGDNNNDKEEMKREKERGWRTQAAHVEEVETRVQWIASYCTKYRNIYIRVCLARRPRGGNYVREARREPRRQE